MYGFSGLFTSGRFYVYGLSGLGFRLRAYSVAFRIGIGS